MNTFLLILFVPSCVIFFVGLIWNYVKGIDTAKKMYPDYKGEDMFGAPETDTLPKRPL